MIKQTVLALSAIGLSASLFAGTMGNQVAMPAGIDIIAPDSVGVWSFGIEGLYVKPANSDYQYAKLETDTTATVSPFKNKTVSNDYNWGGTIDATYMFPGNSRDLKLAYTHLHLNDSSTATVGSNQSLSAALGSNFYSSTFQNLNDAGDSAYAKQDSDLDAVDLVFGQWAHVGERVDLHSFGGIRYANIRITDTATYFDNSANNYASQQLKSSFEGIGPRAGFEGDVHLGYGFSIIGNMGASLLVGDKESKLNLYDPNLSTTTTANYKNSDETHIVPELDARLGLDYMYAFTPDTSMNLQLGWQVSNYFNLSDTDGLDMVTPNTMNNTENFGYHGPYIRLQVNLA